MTPIKAALLASLERYFGFTAAFVTSIIISRLLTPAEVGTFSVAMAITGLAGVIREFGAASYLIRSPTITERHESCAFGLSLLLGWGIGGLLLLVAPLISSLFNNQGVTPILQLLCLNFFIVPFGTVQSSLLQRSMRFDVLTRIGIACAFVSMTTTITLAWLGFGPYALAIGAISLTATASVLSILLGPSPWFRMPRLRGSRELLTFGLQNTGLSMIWEINGRFPDFIIGQAAGMHAAGLLSRASSLASSVNDLLMKGIGAIALPYLSQVQRDSGKASEAHLRMASIVTSLGVPLFATLAYLAPDITVLLYGEKWLEMTTCLRLLCLMYFISLPFSFQIQLIIAKGFLKTQLRASLILLPIRLLTITASAHYGGLNGMAIGIILSQILGVIIGSIMVWPSIEVTWRDYIKVLIENRIIILATVSAVLISEALLAQIKQNNIITVLLYSTTLSLILFPAFIYSKHPLYTHIKNLYTKYNAK